MVMKWAPPSVVRMIVVQDELAQGTEPRSQNSSAETDV
jgi:hypothetical protein